MASSPVSVASATPLLLLLLLLVLALIIFLVSRRTRRRVPPNFVRRTYTAPTTYIAEAIAKPNQVTSLVFPAPSPPRQNPDITPTLLRDFTEVPQYVIFLVVKILADSLFVQSSCESWCDARHGGAR